MEEKKTGFRIGLDDAEEEIPPQFVRTARESFQTRTGAAADILRVEKINRRLTLLALLLPCLFAAALYYVYKDIGRQIALAEQSGAQAGIQAVSRVLDAKSSELEAQYVQIQKSLAEKEEPLKEAFLVFEKTSASLGEKLGKVEENLRKLSESKASKESLESLKKETGGQVKGMTDRVSEMAKNFGPLSEELKRMKKIEEHLAAVNAELEKVKAALKNPDTDIKSLTQDISRLKTDIVDILAETIDRKTLNSAIGAQQKQYQKEIDTLGRSIGEKDKSIKALQKQVSDLENRVKTLSARPLGTPKPGTILEQDLQ
ncbi:MAG: hypothetical protein AB7S75_16985 [Desulfococcaceae bacterium]